MIYQTEDVRRLKSGEMSPADFDAKYGQGSSQEALKPPAPVEKKVDDGQGFLEEATDVVAQVIPGIADALDNTGELVDELGTTLRDKGLIKNEPVKYKDSKLDKGIDWVKDSIGEPKNPVSGFSRGVSQFITGWYSGGKFVTGANWALRSAKIIKGAKKVKDAKTIKEFSKQTAKSLAGYSTKGAIVDAVVFDSHDARLSDLINNHAPWLENPVTRFLASDSDDTFWEGRLKNALEGVLIGGALDSFLTILRYRRFAKNRDLERIKSPEQIQKDLEFIEEQNLNLKQAIDEVDNGATKSAENILKQDEVLSPETIEGRVDSKKSIDEVTEEVTKDKRKPTLEEKQVDELVDDASKPNLGQDKKTFDILVTQIEAFKRGEIDAVELDAGLNIKYLDGATSNDILLLDRVAEQLRKNGKFDEGIENQALVERLARMTVEKSPGEAIQQINNLAKNVKNSTQIIAQSVILAQTMVNAIPRIARIIKAQADPVNAKLLAKQDAKVAETLGITIAQARLRRAQWTKQDLRKLFAGLSQVLLDANWVKKQFARGTAFGNRKTGVADISLDKFKMELENIANFKGDEDGFITRLALMDLPPEGIMKILNKVLKGRSWDIANEWWINFLLSSPKTHIVNCLSNSLMTGLRPAEKYFYGVLSNNKLLRQEGLDIIAGTFHAFRDASKFAWRAMRNEDSVLDVGFTKTEGVERATGEGFFGKVLRGPTRFLSAEDEFFKQLNYRAKLFSTVNRIARLKGLSRKKTMFDDMGKRTSEYDEFVKEEFAKGFDKDFKWTNLDAIDYARELTFTKQLDPRSIAGGVNATIRNNPGLRQAIPFLRTPMNIMHSGLDRIPVFGIIRKEYRQKLLGNKKYSLREIQDARSKATMGMTILGLAGLMSNKGMITGGGPKDYELRKVLYRTGWRPYSIKIGDKYISYARLEPISMVLGTLSDLIEISGDIPPEDKANFEDQLFLSFLSTLTTNTVSTSFRALSKNLLSKTYLKGLSDLLEASMSEDEYKQQQVMNSFLTSRVIPSIVKNMNNDPYYREVRGGLDAIRSKFWLTSEGLDPKFNFLGEKDIRPGSVFYRLIWPIDTSDANDDLIWNTLADLEYAVRPVDEMLQGVDLKLFRTKKDDKSAYVELNEIIAKDMRKELTALIKSTSFNGKSADGYFEGDTYIGGKRQALADKIKLIRNNAIVKLKSKTKFKSKNGLTIDQATTNKKNNRINWKNSRAESNINEMLRATQ